MATSLYRKYRPQRFSELVGQEHVARALQNALSENRLAHAYLFSGTRGTGKTSSARILGSVLNCQSFKDGFPSEASLVEPCGQCESCIAARAGNSFDVIELDAASNNGVDDMRDLIEKVSYTSAAGGTKVYIIDEVHELTGRAANALLKTLEEPPEHVVFILATTNPEKVLPTIRSRTQHFEFLSLAEEKLFDHAKDILSRENRQLDDEAINYVVRKGAGSVRDMLSYLDQVLALEVTSMEELQAATSSSSSPVVLDLIVSASSGDVAQMMSKLHELSSAGKEPRAIVENIITVARDCLIVSLNPDTSILLSEYTDKEELKNVGDKCGSNFLRQFILKLGKAVADMRGTATLNPLLNVEVALLGTVASGGNDQAPAQTPAQAQSQAPKLETRMPSREPAKEIPKQAPARPASVVRPASQPLDSAQTPDVPTQSQAPKSRGTLGALKKETSGTSQMSATSDASRDSQAPKGAQTEQSTNSQGEPSGQSPARKLTVRDVVASWPKVVELLSVASRESIIKANPIKLEGDVLTFGVATDDIDEVKTRFKKDAAIVRGFLESLHETSFRFKIVADDSAASTPASAPASSEIDLTQESNEKIFAESEEYDPVDTVVSMFGGEVVPES